MRTVRERNGTAHDRELRGIAASFIYNSNANGNVGLVPRPAGRTNLISTLQTYKDQTPMAVTSIIILVTDGQENCFRGKISLPIGDGDADGDQEAEIDFGEVMDTKGVFSRDYLKHTATFLECNAITQGVS